MAGIASMMNNPCHPFIPKNFNPNTQPARGARAPLAGWVLGLKFFGMKGWQGLFIIEAIPAIIFAFILVRWMADSPKEAQWLEEDERQWLITQFEEENARKKSTKDYTLWQAFSDREVIKLCLTYFLWITGFWGFGYWMPTVLKSTSNWSNLAVGWMIVIPMMLSLFFMLWIGHRSSVTGEKRWHGAIGTFIAAIGLLCGTMSNHPIWAFFFLCVTAIGIYAPFGVWWSYPTTFLSGKKSRRIGPPDAKRSINTNGCNAQKEKRPYRVV